MVQDRVPDGGETIVFTEEHEIVLGEGDRISKEGIEFWAKISGLVAQED